MEIYVINLLIYNAFLAPIIFFSIVYYIAAISTIFSKNVRSKFRTLKNIKWPKVSIQIPVYNDPVAVRCIKKCMEFDYPKDRMEIIVADDSNDNTVKILDEFVRQNPEVKLVRRDNRKGFKAGALNNILKHSSGEYIVVFDSDFVPKRDFLKKIIRPFLTDAKLGLVQSRMGYLNYKQNIISRFAGLCMMVYHNCVMPLNNKLGTVFFCGTHGAIKRGMLEKLGGWNEKSVTEDADLSVKSMDLGYKHIYLSNLTVDGEVPFTLGSFLKQQKRWAYGTTKTFMDNWKRILFGNFSFMQKLMLVLLLSGYAITPMVVGAGVTGQLNWILPPLRGGLTISDILASSHSFIWLFSISSGFLTLCAIGLYREGYGKDFLKMIFPIIGLGLILAASNAIAFFRAVFGRRAEWVRTPKFGSLSILRMFKWLFRRL